jgi:hypothetical protein
MQDDEEQYYDKLKGIVEYEGTLDIRSEITYYVDRIKDYDGENPPAYHVKRLSLVTGEIESGISYGFRSQYYRALKNGDYIFYSDNYKHGFIQVLFDEKKGRF